MQKLCNIVREKRTKLDFKLPYNDVECLDKIDPTLPTLVIGFSLAKKIIKGFNILVNYYPSENIYWVQSETESYAKFEEGLKKFSNNVVDHLVSRYHYENIDVITLDYERLTKIQTYCKSEDKRVIYFMGNHIFFLSERYKIVWGMSIDKLEYMGWSVYDTLPFDKTKSYNRYISDLSEVPTKLRKRLDDNVWKIMVLMYYFNEKVS